MYQSGYHLSVVLKTQGMTISAIRKEFNKSKSVLSRLLKLYDDTTVTS